ncbi:hypothetical protein SORBI_3008G160100 [Sorghum bicolor]|uniref:Uncharacterized protein n=1 Tax=Sorghum bicolor TaxID=4558 RepID=A0A1B6PE20_SORBI|nr:hypothetical protein SORBI_3008G160100 [Sorghum bicolor]
MASGGHPQPCRGRRSRERAPKGSWPCRKLTARLREGAGNRPPVHPDSLFAREIYRASHLPRVGWGGGD